LKCQRTLCESLLDGDADDVEVRVRHLLRAEEVARGQAARVASPRQDVRQEVAGERGGEQRQEARDEEEEHAALRVPGAPHRVPGRVGHPSGAWWHHAHPRPPPRSLSPRPPPPQPLVPSCASQDAVYGEPRAGAGCRQNNALT